jgi:hypothetical protein
LYGTEIIGKESLLYRPKAQDKTDLRRLEGLDSLLTAIERWFEVFHELPLVDWIGIPFGIWTQFSQCLTLLFRLTTLDEPGWDTEEVRKRADVLDILEGLSQGSERLAESVGMVDATGESGVFFKAPPLIRGMRAKFAAEMTSATSQMGDSTNAIENPGDFAMCFADDPWLAEMFASLQEY